MTSEILILGAGPAGLACAMELSRKGRKSFLVERDAQIGGLAKTLTIREGEDVFLTDIGPHRFFSKNQYLYDFIEDLLQEEWRKVPRLTRQFIDGKFFDYPVKALQVFKNIGPVKSVRILLDYAMARLRFGLLKKPMVTFEDYVVANFGRTLAEFSMINYTEKIWGIPASTIHPDWARQRIHGLNLWSVALNILRQAVPWSRRGAGKPKSLVDEFYYPQFGTGRIYEEIGKHLQKAGCELHTDSEPIAVRHDGSRITAVDVRFADGATKTLQPQTVVESVPITRFLELLDPPPPPEVKQAAAGLKWRAQVYLFLTLDKESVTKDNWIYFPNKDIPFGRTSEMKNFSADMCPPGKTSFFVEFFAFESDAIWSMDKDQVLDLVMPYFEQWGFFTRAEVRQAYLWKRPCVYPVYDMDYDKRLSTVREYLDRLSNLIYLGRPGRFRYTNQDHSLEMGIVASRMILEGRKYDLDTIGSENEYFEKGPIYEKRI
ncbi:MAG: FAD-dependent oxidoreductase [Planctomycetes bacterium]|nr:FAD-dependent oxidoreductase [Planctomycetota bacterium]